VQSRASRRAIEALIAVLFIAFLAWFSMKFHMDNASDSETDAYVSALIASATHGPIMADATGHYTALTPYVMWPFTATLQRITGAYQIRGLVFALLFLGAALYAAAYAWYQRLGLGWFARLLALIVLSTSVVFALLIRGWEIDKLIEPALFLLAAIAAWDRRYIAVLPLAALAAANRETGIFIPVVVLAAMAHEHGGVRSALRRWPIWACALICAAEVVWLRRFGPTPTVGAFWEDLKLDRLAYVTGGLCLTPLLATAWAQAAPLPVRRLFYLVAPAWVLFVLATDRLEQGAVLLTPLALLWVPLTLQALEYQRNDNDGQGRKIHNAFAKPRGPDVDGKPQRYHEPE
jgi:hypothetical protein